MKKNDSYKDKGLRAAVQHKNETAGKMTLSENFTDRLMQQIEQQDEKSVQHRVTFWPWIVAACVAAFLVVLLAPPREETITEPQIAKVATEQKQVQPMVEVAEVKQVEPMAEKPQTIAKPRKPHKARQNVGVSKGIIEEEKEPVMESHTLRPVEEGDIVPYEDPMVQFAEQAKALRERGNRVFQRVSMNSITPDNYPLIDL